MRYEVQRTHCAHVNNKAVPNFAWFPVSRHNNLKRAVQNYAKHDRLRFEFTQTGWAYNVRLVKNDNGRITPVDLSELPLELQELLD